MLQWEAVSQAVGYLFELATDPGFTSIVEQQLVYKTSYIPSALSEDTIYYWRVKTIGGCGEGPFGSEFSFRTIQSDCKTLLASGTPVEISPAGTPTISSKISFVEDFPVVSAKVSLDVEHTYLADLIITLTSPTGTVVTLVSNSCAQANDISAEFVDGAPPFICGNNPAISGTVRPLGSLNSLAGESSFGEWTLTIEDTAPSDGGQLNDFSLELCVEGTFRPDADGDGVFDDGDDLCLGTPPGTEVDASGCAVYRFDPQQFQIELATEQCVGSADGTIRITASEDLQYAATLTGPGPDQSGSFDSSFEFSSLSSGTYRLCLDATDGGIVYETLCFDLNIGSPEPLSVLATPSVDGSRLDLILEGSEQYLISLNGREEIVSASAYSLELEPGSNALKVEGIPACKGSYQATYFYAEQPKIAPNPFSDRLDVYLPWVDQRVEMEIFNAAGSLIFSRDLQISSNRAEVRLPQLPSGLYLVRLRGSAGIFTSKLFRR
jgi:subtilisin-like proprotein convertase family protein